MQEMCWSITRLEENIGIIAASLPTIRPLFRRFDPISRVSFDAAKNTFTANHMAIRTKKTTMRALEEGPLSLHPISVSKTTVFQVDSDGREAG